MSREGEAVQGAVPREEGFASVLRRDAWVKPFFFRYRKALALALFLGLLTFGFASALMFTSGYLVSASAVVETILFCTCRSSSCASSAWASPSCSTSSA